MARLIHPADIEFFLALANACSITRTARKLGVTPAAVSKHLSQMEARIGVALFNRTTRSMGLTPEGEIYLDHARTILGNIGELEDQLLGATASAQGLLRVNATLGFGRSHIAPLISEFVRQHPRVDVQLQLSVNPPPGGDDSCDICFRFGNPPDSRSIARLIAANRRVVVASPAYLKKRGEPRVPADLVAHNCIGIRQGDEAYGLWRFAATKGRGKGQAEAMQSIKIRGNLTTNDGGIAVQWALDGHGILLRAEWDVRKYLQSGRLVQLLPGYSSPDADIYAVYGQQHRTSQRVKTFLDFVVAASRT